MDKVNLNESGRRRRASNVPCHKAKQIYCVRVRPPASVAANADSIEIIIIAPELINYDVLHDGKVQRFQDTMNADVQRRLWRETMM